ncbi:PREDICTED: uncharacterized protein LOC106804914 isoform X2 [Priapulus caudatus]|uniref:Uncharacterized protein LOC106804914 isoform X2 n=1 Tax=Priapulus caudatus TaxID=37621 RepID=A0ABM1DPD3_PRICU|nr:PREDICTED: uncharacterized protein LOC106804914 isoform X2 [Priapulus caudatus]
MATASVTLTQYTACSTSTHLSTDERPTTLATMPSWLLLLVLSSAAVVCIVAIPSSNIDYESVPTRDQALYDVYGRSDTQDAQSLVAKSYDVALHSPSAYRPPLSSSKRNMICYFKICKLGGRRRR